jgi:hypothetical protein
MSVISTLEADSLIFTTSGIEDIKLTNTSNGHATFSSNAGNVRLSGITNPTALQDAATKDYVDKNNVIQYQLDVQKNPTVGQFGSIKAALDSILISGPGMPYLVNVGPGIFEEDQMTVPTYVSVKGSSINPTVVKPNVPGQYLFIMSTVTELSFMTLEGITGSVSPGAGTGYSAVYCEDVGDFAQLHKVSISGFDIGIKNKSITTDSILYSEYVDIDGDFSYGIVNESSTSPETFEASMSLENTFLYPSTNTIKTSVLNNGVNSKLSISACSLTGGSGMSGVVMKNGGIVTIDATTFEDYTADAILSENTGDGVDLKINAPSFINCVRDFSIENAGTTGYFFGNSPRDNHFIISGSAFFVAGVDNNVINVSEKGGDFSSIKAAVDSIVGASISNVYIVKIGPGIYVEDTIVLSEGIFLLGSFLNGTTVVPSDPDNKIIVACDGSYIRDLYLTGATGTTGVAIYFEGTTGLGTLARDCSFGSNTVQVEAYGAAVTTAIVVDRCAVLGNCETVFKATNTGTVPTRFTADNVLYRKLTPTICTYFIYAEGTGVLFNSLATVALVAQETGKYGVYLNNGAELYMTSTSMSGFDKALYVPAASSNPVVIYGAGVIIDNSTTYDIQILSANTVGTWQGITSYTKVSIPISSTFYLFGQDLNVITVQKAGGDFSSIAAAVNSITGNTSTNRFLVQVGPGVFTEPVIQMKPYVTLTGSDVTTRIVPDAATHHIIEGSDFSGIDSLTLAGAGIGYYAIYHESSTGTANTAFIVRSVTFGQNDGLCQAYGNVGNANIIMFSCKYGGTDNQFNKGFIATNNSNTVPGTIKILSTTSQSFITPVPEYVGYVTGENCSLEINGFNAINEGSIEVGTSAFICGNKAHLHLMSVVIKGFENGIYLENTGTFVNAIVSCSTIIDCTNDLNIDHPDATGSIEVSARRLNTIVNGNPDITIFIVDPESKGIVTEGPFYYSKNGYNNITDISNLILNTPTLGLLSGGALTVNTGLDLDVAAGSGYNNSGTPPNDIHKYQVWAGTTITLTASTNSYVYVNSSGTITSGTGYPDTETNILLGKVSTDATDIIYIQKTPLNAEHYNNNLNTMLKNAFGPVYSSGSSVASVGTRNLNISSGVYYFTNLQFNPAGANPATWTSYYRSGTPGVYTPVASQTTVPNNQYDDGTGTLAALTTSYYTKHLLCLLGGPSEVYALIYGQDEYATQGAAEAAGLPISPSFVSDAFVNVVSIVVQQGNAAIVSFIDERPRIGFASSSVTGVITVHGDLLGLAANDHPQYLLVDGGAPGMLGDLDMNGNDIIDPGLYGTLGDQFNVSAHASRHAFNGADPLTAATSGQITEISDSTNAAGTSNSGIPRADHQHAHGNRGGGTLHAVAIAAGAAGFMSGADKSKLDGIAAGATNTTASNTAPLNVTKSAADAGVSAEVSRQDHKHDISTAAAITLDASTTNTEGTATSLARSDHTHVVSSAVVVQQLPDQTNAAGNAASFARSDHIHNIPSGVPVSLNANSTTTQGAAASFAISNHSHAIASGVPSNQTIAAAVATGTSTNFARADHLHTFSTAAPSTVGTANTEGTSTSFARADHVHNHGAQTDPSLHALAIAGGNAGFMSGSDKTNLNTLMALNSGNIFVGSVGNAPVSVTMSGDATIVAGGALTLATVNASSGSTTLSSITTNAKGLVTSNTTGNLSGDITSTGLSTTYNNVVPATKGGTGINNGSSTITLGGSLTTSGAFASTFTMTATTGVTFPTSGTLATTSQLPTPAALTKTDDTNVTLTLGGTPSTALLQATSITAGWTGTLGISRGGTGLGTTPTTGQLLIGNGTNYTLSTMSGDATIASSGAITLATVNASSGSTTLSSITTNAKGLVTSNTTGNLTGDITSTGLTTTYNNNVPLTKGGTNAALTASNGGIFYSTATAGAILAGTATARQMLQSGASTTPAWSTATWPATTTVNRLLYSSATNTVSEVTTANSAVLLTSAAGVPTYSSAMTNGQLIIGNTGSIPVAASLTAGSGIAITTGAASITIANSVPLFRAYGPSAVITPGAFPVAYTSLTTYNAPTFDAGTYSYAAGVATILVAGVYEVCYTVQFNSNGATGSVSGTFQTRIIQNGVAVAGSITECNMPRIAGTNNRTHNTKSWIITAALNDTVAIQYAETTTNTVFQVTANESVFTIKRLQ